jgi:mono/diheme cytochrome c family protein
MSLNLTLLNRSAAPAGDSLAGRSVTLCLATLVFTLGATLACADRPSSARPSPAVVGASGAEVYGHICQGCHMPQGQGAVGAGHYPKLAGDPALASGEYVAATVLGGRNGMPSFGQQSNGEEVFGAATLSDQQIADVVNYVRSHFGNTYKDKVTVSQVAALPHPGTPVNLPPAIAH